MSQQKLDNALKQLMEDPGSTSVQVQVGQAYLEDKNYRKAKEHFKAALDIDPKNVQAYIGLGNAYRAGRASLKYLLKAVGIDPSNADALVLTGRAYRKFRENKKAIEYLSKSLEIVDNATAWVDLGICYFYEKDIYNAINCMEKAVEIDPKLDHAYVNLCRYNGEIGELLTALQSGERAISLNTDNPEAYFVLSFIHSKLGDFQKTIADLEKTVSLFPHHKQAHYQLGNVYLATGDYSKAQASFENALRIDAQLGQAHIGLAMVYMDLGQPEEALEEFRHASFRGVSKSLSDQQYALEVGKRNISNRRYLHIESLQNMGLYFTMLPQPEAKEYGACLVSLYSALVEKKLVIDRIKDVEARNINGRLYQLISGAIKRTLEENRNEYLGLKSYVASKTSTNHSFLAMLTLRWDEVERYLQNYLPVFPRIKLSILRADNLIYHEQGSIQFKLENIGLLPAHNATIKVQPSNEFGTNESRYSIPELTDNHILPFALTVYTEGSFAVSVQLNYDEGETEIQTFRFQAFRKNPYYYGRPIKDSEMFYGREILINSILARIKNVAKQDILIHGIRRIGKSSLLYQIKNKLQLPLIPIYFSLQQIGQVDSLTVLRQLMLELTDAFCASLPPVRQDIDAINISASMLKFDNVAPFDMVSRAFRKDLEALFAYATELAPGIRFIILLDEGDLLFRIGVEMQRFLRDLLQRYDQVVMVVAGSPKILELSAGNYDSPFYNNFAHENLTGVDFEEAKELICRPMEALGVGCGIKFAKEIYDFCGGIAYYIQAICFHMLNTVYDTSQTECTKETLSRSKEVVFSELKKSFKAIWLEFSEVERDYLCTLSQFGGQLSRNSPELTNKGHLSPGLTEYEILSVDKDNISIRAGLVKMWIQDICADEN